MAGQNPTRTEAEAQAEDLSIKGKPKRNLKAYLFVFLGCLLMFFLFKDNFFTNDLVQKKVEVKPEPSTQAKISAELEAAEKARVTQVPPPLPAAPVTPTEKAEDAAAKAKLEAEKQAALRLQSIIASPMSVSEVRLGADFSALTAKEPNKVPSSLELQKQMMATGEKMIADALKKDPTEPKENPNSALAFVDRHSKDSYEEPLKAQQAKGRHMLMQGHLIRTVLLRAINSDVPGSIVARVVSNVYDSIDGRTLVIPKGTIIYGEHSSEVGVGQTRILMAADRMIYPDGKSVSLQKSTTSDMRGSSGIEAKVDNHFFQMFGTSLLVGATSWLMPAADQSTTLATTAAGTQTGGTIVGQSLAGVTKSLAERNRVIKPTLTLPQGELFIITVGRDVILEEYRL